MSVLSTLALLVTAAVRPKPKPSLFKLIDALEARVAFLEGERDDWRARAEAWRERAIDRIDARPPQPAGPDFRPPELARAQELQWYAAQQQLAQQSQNYQQCAQMAQQNQLAAQQNLYNPAVYGPGVDPELWCNCVPSRAQVWAARPGDGA